MSRPSLGCKKVPTALLCRWPSYCTNLHTSAAPSRLLTHLCLPLVSLTNLLIVVSAFFTFLIGIPGTHESDVSCPALLAACEMLSNLTSALLRKQLPMPSQPPALVPLTPPGSSGAPSVKTYTSSLSSPNWMTPSRYYKSSHINIDISPWLPVGPLSALAQ